MASHIYETAGFYDLNTYPNWREDNYQLEVLKMMYDYSDKIVFHATGHDHLGDFRYSDKNPYTNEKGGKNYLNKIIFPSITPTSYTNPTYSTFKYDTET